MRGETIRETTADADLITEHVTVALHGEIDIAVAPTAYRA
jgi:hypothetical protein